VSFIVPSAAAGLIVGKKGVGIQKFKSLAGVKLSIPYGDSSEVQFFCAHCVRISSESTQMKAYGANSNGLATISRLFKIIGSFRRILSLL